MIGKLVKFKVPTLHGQGNASGIVKRVFPDGRMEVKAQLGGYHIISVEESAKIKLDYIYESIRQHNAAELLK